MRNISDKPTTAIALRCYNNHAGARAAATQRYNIATVQQCERRKLQQASAY